MLDRFFTAPQVLERLRRGALSTALDEVACPHLLPQRGGGSSGRQRRRQHLRRVTRQARLDQNREGRRPRLHDMRHTMAVRTLLRWHREGAEVDRKMPALSTYLGHVEVSDTYWYLTAVPELMALTAARFQAYRRRSLGRMR